MQLVLLGLASSWSVGQPCLTLCRKMGKNWGAAWLMLQESGGGSGGKGHDTPQPPFISVLWAAHKPPGQKPDKAQWDLPFLLLSSKGAAFYHPRSPGAACAGPSSQEMLWSWWGQLVCGGGKEEDCGERKRAGSPACCRRSGSSLPCSHSSRASTLPAQVLQAALASGLLQSWLGYRLSSPVLQPCCALSKPW